MFGNRKHTPKTVEITVIEETNFILYDGHHYERRDPDDIEELRLLHLIISNQNKIMATLDEVLADVTEESTVIASLSTLTAGIKAQLDAVLAGNLPPGVQAKVDAIFAGVEANKAAAAKAITDNTPAETPPAA